MQNPGKLLWVDLEMTGLDDATQRIVEVAAIVTDWEFEKLSEYHAIVKQPQSVLEKMDEWCKIQHKQSGLLEAIPKGTPENTVEEELVTLIKNHCETPVILAGNSVHFDRRFIKRYWPKVEELLHYRILDVSSWKVVMAAKYDLQFRKSEAHRALDDISGSIEELRYYLKHFKK